MPLGGLGGVGPDDEVESTGGPFQVRASEGLLGRVLDGLGRPFDGGSPVEGEWVQVDRDPPAALGRRPVAKPLATGVRVIDGLLTLGEGQRVGLFAGSGVGKSSLLGAVARGAEADVVVVALVGERGREVGEFLERALGAEGRRKSVVVVATSDVAALERLRAAQVATAYAEHFRDRGARVLLLVDSVTRFARALREVGLAAGEPPARRGYPPSVFAMLPRLLERAGQGTTGSITAMYTVLVEGGDMDEPIADEVRGILDGHIVLDRSDRGPRPLSRGGRHRVAFARDGRHRRKGAPRGRPALAHARRDLRGQARFGLPRRVYAGEGQRARRSPIPHGAASRRSSARTSPRKRFRGYARRARSGGRLVRAFAVSGIRSARPRSPTCYFLRRSR